MDNAHDTVLYDPKDFADRKYAERWHTSFDRYAQLRANGISKELALMEAFELIKINADLSNMHKLVLACEVNPYVQERFRAYVEGADVKKVMWSENKAANRLLQLIEDPSIRDSVRLNAITALNILCGYIVLEEGMGKRIGHTLADFAKLSAHEDTKAINGGTLH